jgi:hypothetical protein
MRRFCDGVGRFLSVVLGREPHDWLYDALEPIARAVKILLQMAIAVVAIVLIWRKVWDARHDHCANNLPQTHAILTTIAAGLAVAAAIELAYTLFTDGPDEAIDPLMLGLASALLLQLADAHLTANDGFGTLAYAVSLGVLFAIRQKYVTKSVNDAEPLPPRWERFRDAWCSIRRVRSKPNNAADGEQR